MKLVQIGQKIVKTSPQLRVFVTDPYCVYSPLSNKRPQWNCRPTGPNCPKKLATTM